MTLAWVRLGADELGALRAVLALPGRPGAPLPAAPAPPQPAAVLARAGLQVDGVLDGALRALADPARTVEVVANRSGRRAWSSLTVAVDAQGRVGVGGGTAAAFELAGAASRDDVAAGLAGRVGVEGDAPAEPLGRLTVAGVTALLAGADALTAARLRQQLARDVDAGPPRLTPELLDQQVAAGRQAADTRWAVTAGSPLVPGGLVTDPAALAAGLDELHRGGWLADGAPAAGPARRAWGALGGLRLAARLRWTAPPSALVLGLLGSGARTLVLRWQDAPGGPLADVALAGAVAVTGAIAAFLAAPPAPVPAAAPAPVPVQPPPPTGPPVWLPTAVVGPNALEARLVADPNRPADANLPPGQPVRVLQWNGAWAQVEAENGWRGWVDGRQLTALPPTSP
ncbi:MAG: SH3 domain-containing protein [Acidimicrobiales bacterium]|nr:SH3 domain-containing protein [Acidimicrobiales bacterium]